MTSVARLIDLRHQGLDGVIGAWALDGLVVDPGPEPCVEVLLEGLGGEAPRAILLTHIHLDHAGASGALVRRFPEIEVYVHESGAAHLADPTKLLASASRLYGESMQELWGEVVPVPAENLRRLSGGETVEGLEVEYTPGHASHHVAYLDAASGDAFVGDVAGVRVSPGYVLPPTPPPEIDLEAWMRSLELLERRRPKRLCLTHFGALEDVGVHLARVRDSLERLGELARGGDRESFLAELEAEIAEQVPERDRERLRLAVPPEHVWLGLERYWRRRGVFSH